MVYTITHNHNGSITISTIYDGIRRHMTYYGYTEKEAEFAFGQWMLKF